MRYTAKVFWSVLGLLCLAPAALGQTLTCPEIVQTALAAADAACANTGRNQACYGNVRMQVESRTGASLVFEQRGDIANIADIQSLRLASYDDATGDWGVALMKVQANLPDTLPGQNVTFLLFGDVELTNAGGELPVLDAFSMGNTPLRVLPSADAEASGEMGEGQRIVANGRSTDNQWVRVVTPEGVSGWVQASLVGLSGDLNSLVAADVDDPLSDPAYGPMQSFYFRSGLGDSPCEQAPDSGILVQTPEGAGTISLSMNGADVQLGSTAYLRAVPGETFAFSILEGMGSIEVDGDVTYVPAGSWVEVPIAEDGEVEEPAGDPKPYNESRLVNLPIDLLERDFEIEVLTQEEIDAAVTELESGEALLQEAAEVPAGSDDDSAESSSDDDDGGDSDGD